ncbi:MAG: hypothetical protein SNH01_07965 [Rikenellaceae bacterium]
MKKFLSMLMIASLALASAVSCSDDDAEPQPAKEGQFSGMVSVEDADRYSTYTGQDFIFETEKGEDDSITVTMNQVIFDSGMPYSMDIVLPNVTYISDNVYGTDTITATTIDGDPYTVVTVSNVSVLTVGTTLTVTFDCFVGMSLQKTYYATYTGNAVTE